MDYTDEIKHARDAGTLMAALSGLLTSVDIASAYLDSDAFLEFVLDQIAKLRADPSVASALGGPEACDAWCEQGPRRGPAWRA